jgi:uncharacterized protein
MTVREVVADLNALHDLAERETDPSRRRELTGLRGRLARRGQGAKVSEAAELLAVSAPTVRSWIEVGVLEKVPGVSPVRVDLRTLADVKRVVDLLRSRGHDRDLLSEVQRALSARELDREGPELDERAIGSICRRFHVHRLAVFGSAVAGGFDPEISDVDFLVEFESDADDLFGAYFGLKESLEQLLGRPVDLVMPKALENPYFAASVERTRRDLYAS